MEAALQHIGGRAILNSANLEDGELPGSRLDRVMSLAREYGCAVICLLIDERGQARDVEWKMEIAHRIHQIASERYGLSASDLIFDALTFPLSTGDDDLRRDAMYTIEAIKRIKAEIPGALTTLGVSNVSFGLSPAARHVLNSVFLHECVQAGSGLRHRPRRQDRAAGQDRRRAAGRLPRPDLRPSRGRRGRRAVRPVAAPARGLRRRQEREGRAGGPVRLAGRGAPEAPHHRRRARRPHRRARRGDGLGAAGARHRQRRPARRHAGGGRALRLRPDAAAVRAAVGRDDEVRGRPPRAAHGEGRRRVGQGPARAGHRQGRRPRHRQEPGRHHLHQQRLRRAQPRHQGRHLGHGGQGQGGRRRRARHERAPGEVDADHAGEPGGAQRPRADRHPRAARRGGAHPQLRGARPAAGVRGAGLLRPGRLRRAQHARAAHGDEAQRRVGRGLRARADRPRAAREDRPGRIRRRRAAGALARGRGRQSRVPAAVHRQPRREGSFAGRHRGLRQRDGAVPQPVAVPAGGRRDRRGVQGPHPPDVPPAARRGQGQRRAGAAGRVRLLPRQRRRRGAHRLGVRVA